MGSQQGSQPAAHMAGSHLSGQPQEGAADGFLGTSYFTYFTYLIFTPALSVLILNCCKADIIIDLHSLTF